MRKTCGFPLRQILCSGVSLLWAVALFGHGPNSYQITPDKSTMLIGEWRSFRMVDQNGQAQHKVTWTLSDADAFESTEGDEVQLVPKRAGDFRLMARTDFATAEASVKVVDGAALPVGTVKWSSGGKKGCKTTKIIPAVPRPNGPDIFEQSICEDGEYAAAYTASGVQLWRRKISNNGAPGDPGGNNNYEDLGSRLEPHSTSVCDSVTVGSEQQKVRALLAQHNLSFREEPGGGRVWLVEESNTQCRLWFDEKSVVVKKRKVFVVE
jgi:hypothetical protein